MTATLDTLFAQVLDRPWDAEPRRVYADALSAAGDPRGEFIQLQLALEEREDPALAERAEALQFRHGYEWTRPLRTAKFGAWGGNSRPSQLHFRRGFLGGPRLDFASVLRVDLEGFARATPVSALAVEMAPEDVSWLADHPQLQKLEQLLLKGELDPAGLHTVLARVRGGPLRHLALTWCFAGQVVADADCSPWNR